MGNTPQPQPDSSQPTIYKIRIKGQLDSQWTDWFEGLTITLDDNGDTLITGRLSTRRHCMACSKKCVIWVSL